MKRWQRILFEIFGPPALGGALSLVAMWCIAIWEKWPLTGTLQFPAASDVGLWIVIVMAMAFMFAGVPSVIFAVVMEWRFSRELRPESGAAVVWASGLGGICGAAIILAVVPWLGNGWILPAFSILGFVVGAIVGMLIRWRARASAAGK